MAIGASENTIFFTWVREGSISFKGVVTSGFKLQYIAELLNYISLIKIIAFIEKHLMLLNYEKYIVDQWFMK